MFEPSNLNYYSTYYESWLEQQINLLQQGDFKNLDIPGLIEELEFMGRSQKKALQSFLSVMLMHLLKIQYQPEKQTNSWKYTINNCRREIKELIALRPSLKPELPNFIELAYFKAVKDAALESGLSTATFPALNPYSLEQILDDTFFGI